MKKITIIDYGSGNVLSAQKSFVKIANENNITSKVIISNNLNRYSKQFLKKINLKYIVMCENLSISGINTAGIPDHLMKTLIIDLKSVSYTHLTLPTKA